MLKNDWENEFCKVILKAGGPKNEKEMWFEVKTRLELIDLGFFPTKYLSFFSHKVEDSSHFDPTLAAVDYRVPGIIARINYATQNFLWK